MFWGALLIPQLVCDENNDRSVAEANKCAMFFVVCCVCDVQINAHTQVHTYTHMYDVCVLQRLLQLAWMEGGNRQQTAIRWTEEERKVYNRKQQVPRWIIYNKATP